VATWRRAAEDARGPEFPERAYERRRLHVSPTLAGMVRVDGDLDPETGQTVISALRAVSDSEVRSHGDLRTPPQRRADALGEICRQWLDSDDRPLVGGERPHVTVTVDLQTLEERLPSSNPPGSRPPGLRSGAELEGVGPISAEAARRMTCDASVSRVITRGSSEPLDVGRRTQVVPAGIRRAVVVRDRHCRFPGCDRPQGWSDAHHVVHWAHGGDTALSNLVLLCRRHHRLVHHGFGLEMANGRPRFFRPDGTALDDGASLEERGPP
jgi:5-methylcytosine-specific restriction endonuclease McrA